MGTTTEKRGRNVFTGIVNGEPTFKRVSPAQQAAKDRRDEEERKKGPPDPPPIPGSVSQPKLPGT